MLLWLALVFAALGGLFIAVQSNALGINELMGLPAAAVVIATLGLLYILTSHARGSEPRPARSWALKLLFFIAAAGIAVFGLTTHPELRNRIPFAVSAPEASHAVTGSGAVRLRRAADGRFVAHADINGAALDVLVDTGAATVMLRQSDAEKAGVDVAKLSFDTPVATANGTAYAATVVIRQISIGPVGADNVEALVAKPGSLNESLLGMNFLRRLTAYDLSGEFLTLRQ